ncbi:MAG: hypothetical protein HYU02_01045 [Thaumarchaeota archaeon]|nr:hypothetical protein [Nitrososphaerota archaeon]
MSGFVKFYEDRECTKPLTALDFGEVEAGSRAERWIFARNEGQRHVDEFAIQTEDQDLQVLDYQSKDLLPNVVYPVVFEFAPSQQRQEPLKTKFSVKERYVPR